MARRVFRHAEGYHEMSEKEVRFMQEEMCAWYERVRRRLPWRGDSPPYSDGAEVDTAFEIPADRGYSTWVSEVMLQQTKVDVVIKYFIRWMKEFPTIEALAKADHGRVHEMWAGLGYYSRADRLHQGAQLLVESYNGQLPQTAAELRQLPGIGMYTAGAIASIAFNQPEAIVDGNVIRVMSRLRGVRAPPNGNKQATDLYWTMATAVVHKDRPGDFNQSLMELGATICTPKTPKCSECPVRSICYAKMEMEAQKRPIVEKEGDECLVCIEEADSPLGVTRYPLKKIKTEQRHETSYVVLMEWKQQVLIRKRGAKGLLANQWEFPSMEVLESNVSEESRRESLSLLRAEIETYTNENDFKFKEVGTFMHIFSHIRRRVVVFHVDVPETATFELKTDMEVLDPIEKLMERRVTAIVKKSISLFQEFRENPTKKKQKTLGFFFGGN